MVKKNEALWKVKLRKFVKGNAILLGFLLFIVGVGVFAISISQFGSSKELVYGDDVIFMHYFFSPTCPYCIEQDKFNAVLLQRYPNLKIIKYDVRSLSLEEQSLYVELASRHDDVSGTNLATPTTFIGERANVGFGTPETTGRVLESMIEDEQRRIDENWNETMIRTLDLRAMMFEN